MSDDIVVVDSGEVYETQESSIIAKDEADRAEKWGKLAEERADIATSASFEAINSKDEAAQYAATTKSNRDYVNSLLNSSGFKAVANDMLATPSAIKTALENANNAAESAENASESAGLAAEEAADAAHYADDSRIWAVGSDTEVNQLAPNQGKHSSKTYADLAGNEADRAQQEADRAKQYVDIGELADKITNCITEIPQDIKLELNNGTLTLKAGSKVYVPNGKNADGSNKFDVYTVNQDKVFSKGVNGTRGIILNPNKNLDCPSIKSCYSGETRPSVTSVFWYDTVNNYVKTITSTDASTDVPGCSLLIGIATGDGTSITSIDQVFNGFSYIGSTVFALPGVKGLIPNGRNADGSLKNTEFTVNRVMTRTITDTNTRNNVTVGFSPFRGSVFGFSVNCYYDKDTNFNIADNVVFQFMLLGSVSFKDTKITSFTPKLPFHAVDRNDSSWVAQQAMPSGKYIDLTLGASGSSYTAPANGYFFLGANTDSVNNEIVFYDTSNASGYAFSQVQSNYPIRCMQPVRKGVVLRIDYVGIKTPVGWFRFIYAEGEN